MSPDTQRIANNAPEEKERFLGRQIILICEKIFVDRNRTPAAPNAVVRHAEDNTPHA